MARVKKQRWNAAQSDHLLQFANSSARSRRAACVQPASLFSGAALRICQAITVCADLVKSAMEKNLKFSRGTIADAYQDVANLLVEKKVQMLGIDFNFTCTSTWMIDWYSPKPNL